MRLRVVTLNVGLLRALGGRIEPAPFVTQRLKALPNALRKLNANILALQEIYCDEHRAVLRDQLQDVFPHSAYAKEKPLIGLENGLMLLSFAPIEFRFEPFAVTLIGERWIDRKGILICRIDGPEKMRLSFLNLHTTAGGLWLHPESARADKVRHRQIEQILSAASAESNTLLITGDLNAGPGVSDGNFRQFEEAGYSSIHDLLHESPSDATWDPTNPLNSNGPHRLCPKQRIDHVFTRKRDIEERNIVPVTSFICCQDPVVPTPDGKVTVSDHFGLCVDLEISP